MTVEKQMSLWVKTKGLLEAEKFSVVAGRMYQAALDHHGLTPVGFPSTLGASSFVRVVRDKQGSLKVLKIVPSFF